VRLLGQVDNGGFELAKELREQGIPRYAILSHTWSLTDADEIHCQDFDHGFLQPNIEHIKPAGIAKLRFCVHQAARNGLDYGWVDACCIDKDSSAVLQEAITFMFAWYRDAAACYVYLVGVSLDVERTVEGEARGNDEAWREEIRQSRWFTQLARTDGRHTKRREDKAYSLLGIFNISMPLIHGEADYAWTRLIKETDRAHGENAQLDGILSTRPVATAAPFNSLKNQHEPTCLWNTRAELREEKVAEPEVRLLVEWNSRHRKIHHRSYSCKDISWHFRLAVY
jgi:hypothetical protein